MTSDQQSHIGRPIRRADDDELLGFVMPSTDGSQRYCATSLFDGLLGIHQDPIDAERQVTEVGLPSLGRAMVGLLRWPVAALPTDRGSAGPGRGRDRRLPVHGSTAGDPAGHAATAPGARRRLSTEPVA